MKFITFIADKSLTVNLGLNMTATLFTFVPNDSIGKWYKTSASDSASMFT